jgi:hypothetical protein
MNNGVAGGEGGIRTPGTLSGTPVFKTGAINHSATSPGDALPSLHQALRNHFAGLFALVSASFVSAGNNPNALE